MVDALHRRSPLAVVLVSLLSLALAPRPAAGGGSFDLAGVRAELAAARLEPGRAVAVGRVDLELGTATLRIERGVVYPVSPVSGRVVELVFLGEARFLLEPPDAIERGQLALFTHAPALDERVGEAVLVIASDRAVAALLASGRPPAAAGVEVDGPRAETLYSTWRRGPERRQLDVEAALVEDAAGAPLAEGYAAGWFLGERLGRFLCVVEPSAREQLTLGQLVPLELTAREKRRVERELRHEQKRGRLIDLTVDDLGAWDSWVATSLPDGKGGLAPGHPGFEPVHYELEATLRGRDLVLEGRARIRVRAVAAITPAVRLKLHADLAVRQVGAADGSLLGFHQSGGEVMVLLPSIPAAGEETTLDVAYEGDLIDKVASGLYHLRDSIAWYPHVGDLDRATYEVTFRWPDRLELVAGGTRVAGGRERDGSRWERRTSTVPTAGIGFEVGRFRFETRRVGDVEVRLGMPPIQLGDTRSKMADRILDSIADVLAYYQEIFGPYPLAQLEVAVSPRAYSQSLLGFITLSGLMMADDGVVAPLLGLEDPRTVIAHEVAHQWWGHLVGWISYRDQWLSEAMSNYAAVLYARNRLDRDLRYRRGPTTGWQTSLTAITDDPRPIESLGPLVLGPRLASSHSVDAYSAIVYRKGAVVLDMLARSFGEQEFLAMLRRGAQLVAHKAITTEAFLAILERQSGQDLDAFARQFIYGTGLPEVYYRYGFGRRDDGRWTVTVEARQQSPYRFVYRIELDAAGRPVLARERLEQLAVDASRLVVPIQVALYDPARPLAAENGKPPSAKQAQQSIQAGNLWLEGRLVLTGAQTATTLDVDHEPREVFLDRAHEVFGRFFNERRHPKRTLFFRALDEASAGHLAEAERLCRQALAEPVLAGPRYADSPDDDRLAGEARLLDGSIELLRVRIQLEQGQLGAARAAYERAEDRLKPGSQPWWKPAFRLLEARLALAEGDDARAYRLLDKQVREEGSDDAESVLLLAIAAHRTGHRDAMIEAMARAEKLGADAAVLLAAAMPGGSAGR